MAAVGWAAGLDVTVEFQQVGGTWTDISAYVRGLSTSISRSRALGGVFPPGAGSLSLDNRDGRFSPANASSPYLASLYPGRPVRIKATYNAVTYDVWHALVDDWPLEFPGNGPFDAVSRVPLRQSTVRLADDKRAATAVVGAGELSSARVSRVLAANGWPFGSSVATGNVLVQGTDLSGDMMTQIAKAVEIEAGAFWCAPNGQATFEDKYALITNARSTTSQVTFGLGGGEIPFLADSVSLSSGVDLVVNQAVRGNSGGAAQTSVNSAAIAAMGATYTDSPRTSMIGVDDRDAMSVADAATLLYGLPFVHPRSVSIMPNTAPSTMWAQAFGRKIRDRVTVKVPVPWSGTPLAIQCWIVGISHAASLGDWRTTFDLEPATAFDGDPWFILDSSLLDGTDRLVW